MYIVVSNCLNESHVNKLYSFINSFIDPAHVIYVAEGHNVGSERQSSVMAVRRPIVTWII